MPEPSDHELVRRGAGGDAAAFTRLLARHEGALRALIRRELDDPDEAEDVWQETRLAAWQGLARLQRPERVGAWLRGVARHRCLHAATAARRRVEPLDQAALESYLEAAEWRGRADGERLAAVAAALDDVPDAVGQTARWFYREGLSIADIAARSGCPEGTVKRRLHDARQQLRALLGVAWRPQTERPMMSTATQPADVRPFPMLRPPVTVTPDPRPPFAFDGRELPELLAVPEVGWSGSWALYVPPIATGTADWRVDLVQHARGERTATVDGREGVELVGDRYDVHDGWSRPFQTAIGRLDNDETRLLALARYHGGYRLHTFHDAACLGPWARRRRAMADRGRFLTQADGSLAEAADTPADAWHDVAGRFDVRIGERGFDCVRVLAVPRAPTETDELSETFHRVDGRTVLSRRYNGRLFGPPSEGRNRPWDERCPDHARLVIGGVVFVHYYDIIADAAR